MVDVTNDEERDMGEQIRVSFHLDAAVSDRSLEVPSEPIAVPASIRRKGLSAVLNHLLDRSEEQPQEEEEEEERDEDKFPFIPFDFLVSNKLLRMSVEAAARRDGLSLEHAVKITYFPARKAPESSGESTRFPDWISTLDYSRNVILSGGYDGALHVQSPELQDIASVSAHSGPIKCQSTREWNDDSILIATGSLDQSLISHTFHTGSKSLRLHALYQDGHASSIGSVDLDAKSCIMASGDWDGGLCLWDVPLLDQEGSEEDVQKRAKKQKTGAPSKETATSSDKKLVSPKVSFRAHASNVSGLSWGNSGKADGLVTGSWDHSIKVWDVERQDCILTLNGARVVSCLDTSYHSNVVATGHPDCTVRLWDVRAGKTGATGSNGSVSDSILKPSHKAWISDVRWSPTDPYVLATASHDGTAKIWDIRAALPLHTVRVQAKGEQSLCLAFGNGYVYSGGSECVVRRYALN